MVEAIFGIVSVPIIILNFFAGLIGGLWLVFKGKIIFVILGLLVSFLMPFAYTIVIGIPSLVLVPIIFWLQEKNQKILALFFGFLIFFVNRILDLLWTFIILGYAIYFSDESTLIPFLLFGYMVATKPFLNMASGESPDAIGTHVTIFIIQISCILASVFYLLNIAYLTIPTILLIVVGFSVYVVKYANYISKIQT
ncbi:MAG: hypothetical protein WC410_00525 [Candidatus Paceibacterota bacterium]|jgi:hypothetical protein